MEISGKIPPPNKVPKVGPAARPTGKAAPASPARTDRVELSPQAREIQAALKAVREMDDVDQEKVARIKAQIKAGTYKVDAGKIAARMIDESLMDDVE